MTYSIVARDPDTGELGVGSQSHFFGVGRLVGWTEAGVGAAATQAFVNVDYGPAAIAALRSGQPAGAVVDALTGADPLSRYRQLGVVDAAGRAASFTGGSCAPHAAGLTGDGVAAQGNMLAADSVVPAMLAAYEGASGALADRMLAAMRAAEDAGGDVRGSQSAVLTVVSGTRSGAPWRQVLVDLRVDDHPDPVGELERLLPRQRAFDVIGGVIFEEGLMIGPFAGVTPRELAAKLAGLASAAEALGPENREADFWRAVLLARCGRADEARTLFADLFAHRPALREFLAGIGPLGFLPLVKEYL